MTVAAVILSATPEGAVADTAGQPRVRRLADIAWSGGALPIVVVAADPDGAVTAALAGSEAVLCTPAVPDAGSPGQVALGIELALEHVRETTAALVWPARMTWVGPETITSLIEAHGATPSAILRPTWHGEPGWPVLVPVDRLDAIRSADPGALPGDIVERLVAGGPERSLDVGDPGVTHDVETAPEALPPYEGPSGPAGGHAHEWGEDVEREAGLALREDT